MFSVAWQEDGQLLVQGNHIYLQYPEGVANQLILCARMNPWDRFMALLKKKTDHNDWKVLAEYFNSLDKTSAWHTKETFARLQTHDY